MSIEFDCPSCRTRIRVPDAAAGKKARCPHCQTINAVPEASQPLAPASPSFAPGPSATPGPGIPSGFPNLAASPSNPYAPFPPQPQPASNNPFTDATGGAPNPYGNTVNPYASPSAINTPANYPMTSDQARGKLLGPAIGLCVGALFCLGYLVLSIGVSLANGDLMREAPQDGGERAAFMFGMIAVFVAMGVPSLLMLAGAFAMFRGKGLVLAWTGAIAAVLPCSPCCFVGMGFGIWAMVVLSDPRVKQMMKQG